MKNGILAIATTILLSGCAPYLAPISYKQTDPSPITITSKQKVTLGQFADMRSQSSGQGERWFGLIRNGWGIPIQHLYTEEPVSKIVRDAFAEALKVRGLLISDQSAGVTIEGQLLAFECDAIFNYGATTTMRINVVEIPSKSNLYSNVYTVYKEQTGYGMAVYGGYVDMGKLAEKTLNEVIDKFMADPNFVTALEKNQSSITSTVINPAIN